MNAPSLRKRLIGVGLGTGLLLLLPAIAMQLTREVVWGPGDFLVAAVLLFGAGAIAVLGLSRVRTTGHRAALVLAVTVCLAAVWAELAVGVFS